MGMRQVAIGIVLLVGCGSFASDAAAEEYRGTFAQRLACTPDVMRLCGNAIPDVGRIVACLRENEPQLGASCRAVFESNAAATPRDVASSPAPGPAVVAPKPMNGQVRKPVR